MAAEPGRYHSAYKHKIGNEQRHEGEHNLARNISLVGNLAPAVYVLHAHLLSALQPVACIGKCIQMVRFGTC